MMKTGFYTYEVGVNFYQEKKSINSDEMEIVHDHQVILFSTTISRPIGGL